MDLDQWRLIMSHVRRVVASLPRPSKRFDYSDALIVGMYLWSVAHDRPMAWVCHPRALQWLVFVQATAFGFPVHRRVAGERVRLVLKRLHDLTAAIRRMAPLQYLDGKALPVGPYTKDPDARVGYAGGRRLGKGYKLHAIVTEDRRIVCWCVRPMNDHEGPVARRMLATIPADALADRSLLLLADSNYDAHDLHKDVAFRGGALVTHLRGSTQHPVTLRQMGAARRELLALNQTNKSLVRMVLRQRVKVERTFSNLTRYGGGLGPLPSFVRRVRRVTRWVGVKIILYHTRLALRNQLAKTG